MAEWRKVLLATTVQVRSKEQSMLWRMEQEENATMLIHVVSNPYVNEQMRLEIQAGGIFSEY